MRRLLCAVLGGHSLSMPLLIDGWMRRRCLYDCGHLTPGICVRPVYRNLLVIRSRVTWSQRAAWQLRRLWARSQTRRVEYMNLRLVRSEWNGKAA